MPGEGGIVVDSKFRSVRVRRTEQTRKSQREADARENANATQRTNLLSSSESSTSSYSYSYYIGSASHSAASGSASGGSEQLDADGSSLGKPTAVRLTEHILSAAREADDNQQHYDDENDDDDGNAALEGHSDGDSHGSDNDGRFTPPPQPLKSVRMSDTTTEWVRRASIDVAHGKVETGVAWWDGNYDDDNDGVGSEIEQETGGPDTDEAQNETDNNRDDEDGSNLDDDDDEVSSSDLNIFGRRRQHEFQNLKTLKQYEFEAFPSLSGELVPSTYDPVAMKKKIRARIKNGNIAYHPTPEPEVKSKETNMLKLEKELSQMRLVDGIDECDDNGTRDEATTLMPEPPKGPKPKGPKVSNYQKPKRRHLSILRSLKGGPAAVETAELKEASTRNSQRPILILARFGRAMRAFVRSPNTKNFFDLGGIDGPNEPPANHPTSATVTVSLARAYNKWNKNRQKEHGEKQQQLNDVTDGKEMSRGNTSRGMSRLNTANTMTSKLERKKSSTPSIFKAATQLDAARHSAKRMMERAQERIAMNQIVQSDMIDWLFKHGKHWRTDVPPDEKVVIGECFQLLDADGSGALDADELEYLFETLGLNVEHEDIVHMMEKYAGVHDGGEIGYELFEVMMADFEKSKKEVADDDEMDGEEITESKKNIRLLPFNDLVAAFRRRKQLEDFMHGGKRRKNFVEKLEEIFRLRRSDDAMSVRTGRRRNTYQQIMLPELKPQVPVTPKRSSIPRALDAPTQRRVAKSRPPSSSSSSRRFVTCGSVPEDAKALASHRTSNKGASPFVSRPRRTPSPWQERLDISTIVRVRADTLATSRRVLADAPFRRARAGPPVLPPSFAATPRFTTLEAVRASRRREVDTFIARGAQTSRA